MPYEWVDPEIFMIYQDVVVYHVYKDDDFVNSGPHQYRYCLEACESLDNGDNTFDVRTLPEWTTFDADLLPLDLRIEATIKCAIASGYFHEWEGDTPPEMPLNLQACRDTVLAALRMWQDNVSVSEIDSEGRMEVPAKYRPIVSESGGGLGLNEIDQLCRQLNTGEVRFVR